MTSSVNTVETDVLVIGGGGAGTRAAIEASRAGAKTVLAVKGRFNSVGVHGAGATGVGLSEAGAFFYFDPKTGYPLIDPDEWGPITLEEILELDYQVIVQVGLGMADPKLARVMVQDAVSQRQQIEEWGVEIHGDRLRHHGLPLMAALGRQIQLTDVDVREEAAITDLLVHDGSCVGAVGLDFQGNTIVFKAGAVVLCSGGDAGLYRHNFHPPDVTGDGHAMAYNAGATLMNMEFGQFFLSTLPAVTHPSAVWLFQPGVRLKNGLGQEFLPNYLPDGITSDEVFAARTYQPMFTMANVSGYADIAMMKEVLAGRAGPYGGALLDLTDPSIVTRSMYAEGWLAKRGIEAAERPLEIVPARHCSHGGPRIDEFGRTDIAGLYAGGGEAASGPQGADRMGGHMLGSGQVFGTRAGRDAARYANENGADDIPADVVEHGLERIRSLGTLRGSVRPREVKRELRRRAWEDMNVIRSEEACNRVLETIARIHDEFTSRLTIQEPFDRVEAMEVLNMLTVAEMTAKTIAMRTESRGGHYREDYPEQDDAQWLKSISIRKEGDEMTLGTIALDPEWRDRTDELKGVSFAGGRQE
ncbi:MAG: FAD-binding protein [SAR202 cluster bacterium]|jgi:succinate dehydrogenase/fumarate reductase flavoprotein subunit|nr:FAD-binding protein [SAR202 cluster bacterium]HJO81651.1 FAD-binding protein [SAR202 cluster bacterium]